MRDDEEEKLIPYLENTSDTFAVLKNVVAEKALLKALSQLTHFCHTGELEVFHSMMLKYVPKRQHFSYPAMKARTMLAVLDWNSKDRRPVMKDGAPAVDQVYSKRRKCWVLRRRYRTVRPGEFRKDLLDMMLFVHGNKIPLDHITRPDNLSSNISRCAKPNKEDMLVRHRSRFLAGE